MRISTTFGWTWLRLPMYPLFGNFVISMLKVSIFPKKVCTGSVSEESVEEVEKVEEEEVEDDEGEGVESSLSIVTWMPCLARTSLAAFSNSFGIEVLKYLFPFIMASANIFPRFCLCSSFF